MCSIRYEAIKFCSPTTLPLNSFFSLCSPSFPPFSSLSFPPIFFPLFQSNNNSIFIFGTRWSPSCIYACIWYTIELENAWKKKSVLNRSKSDDPEFVRKIFQPSNDFSFHTWWKSISVIWLNLTVSFMEHDSSNPFLWIYPTFLSFGKERTREWNRERENHEFLSDSALNINGGKELLTKIWSKSIRKTLKQRRRERRKGLIQSPMFSWYNFLAMDTPRVQSILTDWNTFL